MSTVVTSSERLEQMKGVKPLGFAKRHPVVSYYLLTLLISGLIALPMIAVTQGWIHAPVPFALHYLGAFGPMFAALIMTAYTGGAVGLRELWSRVTRWRVGWIGFVGGVLAPVLLFVMAALAIVGMGGEFPDLRRLGEVNYLPFLGVGVLPLWLATYGFGEEIGWRGFALPRLQKNRSALAATLIVGLMWASWHVQYFFYLDTYVKLGLAMFPLFALGILAGAFVLTWLYNETKGSVLIVAVWHAVFDLLSASKVSQGNIAMMMSAAVMVWAIIVVIVFKPANLSHVERHTL